MKHIHYKNDFEFLLKIMGKDGAVRPVPQYRWSVVFSVGGVRYECSLRDGNATVKGDTIVCRLQDHGFGCGELKAEFREWIPNKEWLDGVVDVSTPIDTDIELWEGKSDDSEEMVSGSVVLAYFVYDAYLTAKANGYDGTAEEYYDAITGVVDIAEAEAGRVSSEELREANEQQRVREFGAMKAKVDNVYTKSESDARYLRGDWELINEVSEYDTSKNKITVAENCDGYKELAVRRTNNNTLSNNNVYLDINGHSVSLQGLSSATKDAVWHIVQDGKNISVEFLYFNFVNTGSRLSFPATKHEYCLNCKIGGKVELFFYKLTTLHDGENIKVYGKR
jgi:hypothetical protein